MSASGAEVVGTCPVMVGAYTMIEDDPLNARAALGLLTERNGRPAVE